MEIEAFLQTLEPATREVVKALAVMVRDPRIWYYLASHDRKALEQAREALDGIGYPGR